MDYTKLIRELINKYSTSDIISTLSDLSGEYPGEIAFSTSFGLEDQVITDIICKNNIPVEIFSLDTGRLFPETYKVHSSTLEKYGKKITIYFPDSDDIEKMMSEKGPYSFYESIAHRKECCYLRKVKPLRRALKKSKCWVTGLRADQSDARQDLTLFQWDADNEVIKYNPLKDWSFEMVKKYIDDNNVPYNVLHDKGFVSIGCQPCTRAIKKGEDFRAGRWWWENNSKKECGLH